MKGLSVRRGDVQIAAIPLDQKLSSVVNRLFTEFSTGFGGKRKSGGKYDPLSPNFPESEDEHMIALAGRFASGEPLRLCAIEELSLVNGRARRHLPHPTAPPAHRPDLTPDAGANRRPGRLVLVVP